MDNPIEGYFLITNEGLIFEIKGNLHPEYQYIAYLRYVFDTSGDRNSEDGVAYKKIYPLKDREVYLRENYPHYLRFDDRHNRVLQVIPFDSIDFVLSPIDALGRIRDRGRHLSDLQRATLELAESLVDAFGIPWNAIGVTGSQLVGLATESSDIDLVVYGEKAGRTLHQGLKKNDETIAGLERYTGKHLLQHTQFRWGLNNQHLKTLSSIESNKLLQGIFDNKEFFIRIVKTSDEMEFVYEDLSFESLGTRVLTCDILDDSQAIFTPCEYQVECRGVPDLVSLVSYRGRYTEHVGKGMCVKTRGTLERVNHRDGRSWLQLILGESSTDYLLPCST
ncbi:MAG: nucleotidyltransferase domain-containing protein [Candidatus Thorarchaeota archaeon]|nr:nucleotidyltransferase domain-containing protein [Candidatus Thorarchaeota archaeon]